MGVPRGLTGVQSRPAQDLPSAIHVSADGRGRSFSRPRYPMSHRRPSGQRRVISLSDSSTGVVAGSWVMACADWIPSAWFTAMNGRIIRSYSANAAW
jgi:hypothetical protein